SDLPAQILKSHIQLAVFELGLFLFGGQVAIRDDFRIALVHKELISVAAGKLEQVSLVGSDAPLGIVLAGSGGFIEVLSTRTPERGRRKLQLSVLERLNVLNASFAVAALSHNHRPMVIL